MKSIYELLKLLLKELEEKSEPNEIYGYSLCAIAVRMCLKDIISYDNSIILKKYIKKHEKYFSRNYFFWNKNDKESRIKWLKRHIYKNKSKS